MILNGKKTEVKDGVSVYDFLSEKGYKISIIAVELNGEILDRDKLKEIKLKNSDVMEVVMFMGGGSTHYDRQINYRRT
ncbi:MAG: sulfur carrier protein ThiS [Clostridiales bacterium]|nr:sulfur carrier protein ThiS [Clostridiales bacterium]MCD8214100.1 sulfur carrier protein ThiS [Clostridiales bacterium]